MMNFKFSPKRARTAHADGAAFRISRLWAHDGAAENEISHLVDRTYPYRSARELRWHLAERFGLPVESVRLSRA
jgi:hypothetical protein